MGVLLVALGAGFVLCAEVPGAGDAAHFLRDGLGASCRGAGSACVALTDDFTAPFWNPAPAVQSPSSIVGGGLEQRNRGLITFSVLGGRVDARVWSAGVVVLASDMYDVYHLSAGFRFGSASAGFSIRSYQFGVPNDRGSGLGLDLGVRWVIHYGGTTLSFAAVSRDIGWTPIRWGAAEILAVDRVAWVNRIAVAVEVPLVRGEWLLEVDGESSSRRPPLQDESGYWAKAGELNISLGTAYSWAGICVRIGVQRYDLLKPGSLFRPTMGLGIAVDDFRLDVALVPSMLGSTYLGSFQVEL